MQRGCVDADALCVGAAGIYLEEQVFGVVALVGTLP